MEQAKSGSQHSWLKQYENKMLKHGIHFWDLETDQTPRFNRNK